MSNANNSDIKIAAKDVAQKAELSLIPLLDKVITAANWEKDKITDGLDNKVIFDNILIHATKEYLATKEAVIALSRIAESGFGEDVLKEHLASVLNYSYTHQELDPMCKLIESAVSGEERHKEITPVYEFMQKYESELLKAAHRKAHEWAGENFAASLRAKKWLKTQITDYNSRARAAGIITLGRAD